MNQNVKKCPILHVVAEFFKKCYITLHNITSSFIVVKTERSTSQQSVTQDSDYIAISYNVKQDSHNNQV